MKHARRINNKTIPKLIVAILFILSMAMMSSCSSSSNGESSGSTLERAKERGYVTVAFAQEKPYAYQDENGELTGEAVEVARAILRDMGIDEMRGELTEFGSLIPGLNAKRYDMVTAGMFVTPERAQEVSFANPEYSIGIALGVKKGNPAGLESYEGIAEMPQIKVAVPAGAIEYDYMLASGMTQGQILIVPDISSAVAALQSDRADAFTATGPSVKAAIETTNDPSLEIAEGFIQPIVDGRDVRGYGATAFRKEDQDFVEAFNEGLEKLKESGELLSILEEFGFGEDELPGDVTTDMLMDQFTL